MRVSAAAALGLLFLAAPVPATIALETSKATRVTTLPETIGGLKLTNETSFEARSPGLGSSTTYSAGDLSSTVFLYDKKLKIPKIGAVPALAERERGVAIADIKKAVDAGLYESADVIETGEYRAKPSNILFKFARLALKRKGQELDSHVYVATHQGRFVKIRLTGKPPAANVSVTQSFVDAVSSHLKN